MTSFNTIGKRLLVATLLAGVGLPASMANAQFKVEYDSKAKAAEQAHEHAHAEHVAHMRAAEHADETHSITINSNDDEHTYELKIINGEIKVAKVDGKALDDDRIKFNGDNVIFLSPSGERMTEFQIKKINTPHAKGGTVSIAPQAMTWVSQDAAAPAAGAQPKVMLGINLTEPSDAVRKQLKLGDDQQAIFVERVIDGLPAKKAGLESYDVIISIDGSDYANGELLSKVLREKNPGDQLKLVVLRGGDKLKLKAELQAYSAEKLGVPQVAQLRNEVETDFSFPGLKRDGNSFAFAFGPEIHEQIMQALHESGLEDDQIERVQKQLHEQLGNVGKFFEWTDDGDHDIRFFASPNAPATPRTPEQAEEMERHMIEAEVAREHAALAQEKARAAMRDAKRQILEMRDGQLIVRQADEMQDQLEDLEDRLDDLEDQLEDQMDELEEQMERMADLLERLIDRLGDRD